jgi:hypothetical protein
MSLPRELSTGVAAGVAGALSMSVLRGILGQAGVLPEQLPHRLLRKLAMWAGLGGAFNSVEEDILGQGSHLAIGALFGVDYMLALKLLNLPPLLGGVLYGLFVYALNLGWLGPALGITLPPWHDKPRNVALGLATHLLFGIVMALVIQEVRRNQRLPNFSASD